MPNHNRVAALLAAALVAGAGFVRSPGLAVAAPVNIGFSVNSALDSVDADPGDGVCLTASATCTLRAAVMEADATDGDATILVPDGIYTLTITAAGLDGPDSGDLNLTTPASGHPTITIMGASATRTVIDARQASRVFRVDSGRAASISGVDMRHGFASVSGGGIIISGSLSLNSSTVELSRAGTVGGGLYNSGFLTLTDSTIRQNIATNGAGIGNYNELSVLNSTLWGQTAAYGGGGILNFNNLTMVNSTLSENNADVEGGGLDNYGLANIYNSTIEGNAVDSERDTTGQGGGIFAAAIGATNIRNTLVARNFSYSVSGFAEDCFGTVHTYGQNLFGTMVDCVVSVASGQNALLNSVNKLGPLQDNGGQALTVALLAGSNAIDWGDPDQGCVDNNSLPLNIDERGIPRVVGVSCDIGAYEFLPPVSFLPLMRR